jgi:haloacetate dehalogenase
MTFDRRNFLKTTLAALSKMSKTSNTSRTSAPPLFPGFEARAIATSGATINVLRGGNGPPLLLLHGYPQTHAEWHKMAPRLAERFTVVMADLRGYGDSSKPVDGENHGNYSKRAMALDQVDVMHALGFDRFAVVGHDRGARVAWRLAVEHPDRVTRAAVIDIVPKPYANVTREFATAYFHWFFLIQPAPFPETLIGNNAEFYLRRFLGGRAIAPEAFAEYLRAFKNPATIHATCEDYRAGATIDLTHAEEDGGRKVACPMFVLWGEHGTVGRLYDVMQIWRTHASDVRGTSMPGGHFLPEELPGNALDALLPFLQE